MNKILLFKLFSILISMPVTFASSFIEDEKNTETRSYILNLPNEMTMYIFDHVFESQRHDQAQAAFELTKVSSVCKHWANLTGEKRLQNFRAYSNRVDHLIRVTKTLKCRMSKRFEKETNQKNNQKMLDKIQHKIQKYKISSEVFEKSQ